MAQKMSIEELQEYMTVAEKNQVFVDEYQPQGCFMQSKHYWRTTPLGEFVVFETTIYGRNKKGDEYVLANGSAAENMSKNSSSTIDPFRFCETSSRGRALAVLGIGLKNGMSSRDDLDCGVDYTGPDAIEADVKRPKVRQPSIEDNLKRLKLDYYKTETTFVVDQKDIKPKTISVLNRYGFTKMEDSLVCTRDDI